MLSAIVADILTDKDNLSSVLIVAQKLRKCFGMWLISKTLYASIALVMMKLALAVKLHDIFPPHLTVMKAKQVLVRIFRLLLLPYPESRCSTTKCLKVNLFTMFTVLGVLLKRKNMSNI